MSLFTCCKPYLDLYRPAKATGDGLMGDGVQLKYYLTGFTKFFKTTKINTDGHIPLAYSKSVNMADIL